MPVSDSRHVLFPAWMNYALFMKAFVSVFGDRLDLFQLMAVPWGGLGSAAVLLLTRELTRSERVSVFAGLLHALSPNAIVYLSASTTPEHVAAPLFCLSTWLFVKCLAGDCGWRRTSACAALAGMLMTGLVVMAFFCLMLVSESQGRYKCLVMPQITAFAASMFMTCRRRRDEGSARCASNDRLCVVMPVYNERGAIGGVLDKWVGALDGLKADYVIRPYNDGSRDDSLAVMTAKAGELNRSRVKVDVRDKPNGGHGHTILVGYREAVADGFGWIFQVDSDDEMGPEMFGELWNRRSGFDFLVGIRDGRRQALPRKIVSFVSRLCVRLFYGKSVWDVNTPYRLMRTSAFADFYSAIPPATFAPNVILSGLAARNGLRSFEIRVPQHDRTTGEVSIRKWKLLRCAVKSFLQTVAFSFGEEWNGQG